MSGLDIFGADLAWEIYKDKNIEKQKKEQDPHYTCKEQMERYKEQIKENKNIMNKLKDKINGNETYITKLQKAYENLCNTVTVKQKQTDKDYNGWVNIDDQYKEYIKELHEYIQKLKQLNIKLKKSQKQRKIYDNNEFDNIQNELMILQNKNESIKDALNIAKQSSKHRNDNIKQQLIETLKLLNEIQIGYKSSNIADLFSENNNPSFTPTYDGIANLFYKTNDLLKQKQNEQNEDMEALIAENDQLKQQIEANNEEINALNSDMNSLENEINELRQQQNYKNEHIDKLQTTNTETTQMNEKLQREIKILKQYNGDSKQLNDSNGHEVNFLKTEIEFLNKQIKERDTTITELQNESNQQKEENLVNENIIVEQNQKIQSITDEIEQFRVLDELQREHIDNYRESSLLQENKAEPANEILELTKVINELQNDLEVEKELNVECQNQIVEQKEQIMLLTEEIEQLHILEEMQQEHIQTFRESGVIEAVMTQEDVDKAISALTDTIDLLEEQLSRERTQSDEYKNEIIKQKQKNDELRSEIQHIIESKLKSMERSCQALEQLRNMIRSLQKQNDKQQIKIEKHALGVLGPLSYHLVDVATMK